MGINMGTIKEKIDYEKLFTIPNFNRMYAITKDGRLWNSKKERWVRLHPRYGLHAYYGKVKGCVGKDTKDFLSARLSKNGVFKTFSIHRLMAEIFLENKEGLKYVHHIDFNRINNKIDNLIWVKKPIIKKKKLHAILVK